MKLLKSTLGFAVVFSGVLLLASVVRGQEAGHNDGENVSPADDDMQERYKGFEQTMSGVRLRGRFTVLGKEQDELPEEEYVIKSVKKLPEGDLWLFNTRIKYGGKDVALPLPLPVRWAGDTPIISLTNLTIPGLGTFSSRVVIYNGKYAGTWTHGDVGGHLFGVVEKLEDGNADE